ncbi:MAG TPA: AI-2E family transporter [Steroidobacteraceae bacterium]|nr:AI-2E family transporter [Steroidobacteraceae bacterium]
MDTHSLFYRRAFIAVTVLVLGYAMHRMLQPFVAAFEWAAVLAFLLHPLHVRLSRRLAGRSALSAGLITALTPIVILAPLSMLGVAFARQVGTLITHLKAGSLRPSVELLDQMQHWPLIGPGVSWLRENVPVSVDQVESTLSDSARSLLQTAASLSGDVVIGVAGTLVGFFLMLFLLYYLLRDGAAVLGRLIRFIPFDPTRRDVLILKLSAVLRAVVFGTAVTAAIQGALVGVGFAIVGLPSPVVFGVLTMLAAFIPAVGTAVVLVPALLYLLAIGRWGALIFLAIWGIAASLSENFLRPMLASRYGEVSTLAVFLGAIGGVATFGLIGIVIGPVLLSLVVELLRIAEETVV